MLRCNAPITITRRSFLTAIGLAFAGRLRPFAAGFTSIADDLAWLMRWCCFGGGLRFAGAG